jgi:hypothetical protein
MNLSKGWSWIYDSVFNPIVETNENDFVDLSMITHTQSNTVIYVGYEGDDILTSFIHENLSLITETFLKSQCGFIFQPALKNKSVLVDLELSDSLSYYFPTWAGLGLDIAYNLNAINQKEFYEAVCRLYGLENAESPMFLLVIADHPDKSITYPINANELLGDELNKIIGHIKLHIRKNLPRSENPISFYDPEGVAKRNRESEKKARKRYNAEDKFPEEASRISREVAEQIQTLLKGGQNKALLNIYSILLKQTKLYKPELLKKFNELNNTKTETPLSRLVVDCHYRIWLPDYNNLEIEMTPLPKALYLIFLNHPEGIMLHDLVDHKKEMLSIYGRITNSSSSSEIKKRINDMTDMSNNSVNEKCSRIKEAFITKMDNAIARNYYITGERGEAKKIILNTEFIHF